MSIDFYGDPKDLPAEVLIDEATKELSIRLKGKPYITLALSETAWMRIARSAARIVRGKPKETTL